MLERDTSGASPDSTQPSQPRRAVPGGPSPSGQPLPDAVPNPSGLPHQFTLQLLIAEIKKSNSRREPTNSEKDQHAR